MLKNLLKILAILLLICTLQISYTEAQSPDIELDIQADPVFSNAQVINLTNLVFDKSGRGSRIFLIFIQNRTDQIQEDLYLDFLVRTQRYGLIVEGFQRSGTPFSLNPGQAVFATNIDLARGRISGIDTDLQFDGGITSPGTELMNRLQGSTRLPVDEYVLEVRLYQSNNRPNGGDLITSNAITIGGDLAEDELSLYLQAPGDVAGTNVQITNSYPEFRWDGQANKTYRIIVVEERDGENPETLIQSAKSSNPGRIGSPGSLLEYEMFDLLVEGTTLQYPSSGVQPLQTGKTYYWQVFKTLQTTSGEEERASDIWSFTLSSGFVNEADIELFELDGELREILLTLLGPETFRELEQQNFGLEGMEVDDKDMHGEMVRDELIRLAEKIRDGKIKIAN